MKKSAITICMLFPLLLSAQEVIGTWNGALEIQGTTLRIVFHVEQNEGQLSSTLDSPDQSAMGIPTTTTTYENGELTISAKNLNMVFSGTFDQQKNVITGQFKQNGMAFPMELKREAIEKKVMNRPQEPKEFPYQQENLKFTNNIGGHELAGTLTIPENGEFTQVVILVSGSGPQDRNERLAGMEHQPFLVLSDYLTRHGIAVLRYDDRGVGESTGDFSTSTTADFATDAAAALHYLQNRTDMKGKKIGLVGHSEGGMIAPMVASQNKQVDFIVMLAGPGIPIDQLMLLQSEKIAAAGGVSSEIRQINKEILIKAYTYMKSNSAKADEPFAKGLRAIFSEGYDQFPEAVRQQSGDKETFVDQQLQQLNSPWFRYFITVDPADYLSQVSCPVLAINGELDMQVTAEENLAGIRKRLSDAGNKAVVIKNIPRQNHLFQEAKTGAPSEYAQIEETFNEHTMQMITDWISKQ